MMEAGVVIGADGEPIHWHLPNGRSGGYLPDSRPLWDVLWENRATLIGFAHSHPGGGVPSPSHEDITTFAAVEAALGRQLIWWITSSESMISIHWLGPNRKQYRGVQIEKSNEPTWSTKLREVSENPDQVVVNSNQEKETQT